MLLGKIVPDTSVLIDGLLSKMVVEGTEQVGEIIIPLAVVDELQAQASKNRDTGFMGLEEMKRLRGLCGEKGIPIRFEGERPSLDDIRLARSGRIDAMIRDVAKKEGAILLTADYVQALVGEAEGARVKYVPGEVKTSGLIFESLFDPQTLSVHLKEGVPPLAKRGRPGRFELVRLKEEPSSTDELEGMAKEINEAARASAEGHVELSRSGATVIQLGSFRIAIARPPFSDGLEVTVVRPLVKLTLEDYDLSERLMARLKDRAEGILIAGPPGSGKTTLASSLAEFYTHGGKIVKTFESPRDLQVGPSITQYGPLEGDFEKSAEILLLVRPDHTIFDEVRKSRDFEVFADMRLAGVGMVGVVHANSPIDAIQRFMGRLDLGVIPHIIDTVIFVKDGAIKKVYELSLTVKVHTGMVEADLARPVVEVRDFETATLEHEIYTFGEENVIVPVSAKRETPVERLAAERILQLVRKFDPKAEVELKSSNRAVVRVDKDAVPRLIGRGGIMINEIEDALGIKIEVESRNPSLRSEVKYQLEEVGDSLEFRLDGDQSGKTVSIYSGEDFVLSATVGKKPRIKVARSSEQGRRIANAILKGEDVKVLV